MKSENNKNNRSLPKKIIYVWNYLEWGGAQIYFLGIARRLKGIKDIRFIFPKGTGQQFLDFCDQFEIEYELIDNRADLAPALTLKRKLKRHINKIRAEYGLVKLLKQIDRDETVLHIELTPWQSILALKSLARRGKVFITMHNRLPEVAKWRFWLWKLKFRIIENEPNFWLFASNRDARESLRPFVSEEFLQKTAVTYTNVDPDEIDTALKADINSIELKKKFGVPENKFLVLCVGQFIDRKGRWIFLEAAEILRKAGEDIVFVWVSNSVLTAEDKARVDQFDLADTFFLLNSDEIGREHLELMKFLRIADVFTLPSYVEGLPISLLEAMAMRRPSISTNVNAIPEAIIDGETGLLIEKDIARELAEAIVRLKNDPELREKLGQAGHLRVLENFNEIKVASLARQFYERAFSDQKK